MSWPPRESVRSFPVKSPGTKSVKWCFRSPTEHLRHRHKKQTHRDKKDSVTVSHGDMVYPEYAIASIGDRRTFQGDRK